MSAWVVSRLYVLNITDIIVETAQRANEFFIVFHNHEYLGANTTINKFWELVDDSVSYQGEELSVPFCLKF